ncbi:unnamed protein product [Sympodiomycopsis kandeliae]
MLSGMLGRSRARESSERERDNKGERHGQSFGDRPRPSISNDGNPSAFPAGSPNGPYSSNPAINSASSIGLHGSNGASSSSHRRQDSLGSSTSGSLRKKPSAIGSPMNISGPIGGSSGVITSPTSSASGFHQAGVYNSTTGEPLLPEEMRAMQRQKEKQRESALSSEMSASRPAPPPTSSSVSSSSSKPATATRSPYSSNHMESSTTRLLVATKMLLESLNHWSVGTKSETEVSDVYVRLGNDFHTARMAFGSYGIDMSDLASVPDDLRVCLEKCLSEEASPAVLEQYLPRVREIIVNLLQGLKRKQAEYKRILVSQQKGSSGSTQSPSISSSTSQRRSNSQLPSSSNIPTAPNRSSRIMRQERQGISEGAGATAVPPEPLQPDPESRSSMPQRSTSSVTSNVAASRKSHDSTSTGPEVGAASEEGGSKDSVPANVQRHTLTDEAFPSSSTIVPATSGMSQSQSQPFKAQASPRRSPSIGRVSSSSSGRLPKSSSLKSTHDMSSGPIDVTEADPSLRALKSRDALERRASKRFSAYTFNKMGVGQGFGNGGMGMSSMFGLSSPNLDRSGHHKRASTKRAKPSISEMPTEESLHSSAGSNRSMPASSDEAEEAQQVDSALPPIPVQTPQTPQRGGALAPPGAARDAKSPTPSHIALSSTDSLPFVDASQPASPNKSEADESFSSIPPVPPLPTAAERAKLDAAQDQSFNKHTRDFSTASTRTLGPTAASSRAAEESSLPSPPSEVSIFLQIGRQTRKASLDTQSPISIARLRMLFVDRFAYSPGKDDFPAIYIKDPENEVSYELEDLNDVTDGCLLTLNIEPLDQVKQHLDLSLGAISRELREVKAALQDREQRDASLLARRASTSRGDQSLLSIATAASPAKFSDSQFAAAGQRVASFKRRPSGASSAGGVGGNVPTLGSLSNAGDVSAVVREESGETMTSPESPRSGAQIASDLKNHYDEVMSLRREMAILRQLQGDFAFDVGGLLKGMKEQSAKVRAIAAQDVPAERNFIIAGKSKLDTNSQEVLTLIEDLQDVVDDLKSDVLQRGVKPKPAVLKKVTADIDRATKGLSDLENYVQTVKPSWKKTWETELQNIVDEQDFLNHSEGLIADLREDHGALQEVYEDIQQVVKLRSAGRPTGGKYIPPLPEEGHEGLSTVMLEVRGQSIDHERRLRALQAAEKNRQKEMSLRSNNEFTDELSGFVTNKAGDGLRKTGGHLEAERIRAKRDKATLLAMFGAGGNGGAPNEVDLPVPKKLILGQKHKEEEAGMSPSNSDQAATAEGDPSEVSAEE